MKKEDLKAIRAEMDITQRELADLLGVGLSTVFSWEQGARNPSKIFGRLSDLGQSKQEKKLRKLILRYLK